MLARRFLTLPLAAGLLLLLGFAVYAPGIPGGFVFDDFPNIVHNEVVQVEEPTADNLLKAAFSIKSGPLYRPLSMLSVALNHVQFGLSPRGYKITNILIHVLTALAAGLLLRLVVSPPSRLALPGTPGFRDRVALCGALLFLVHPFNLTAVLYVIQRMTSMSALFVLLAAACYVQGRRLDLLHGRPARGWPWFAAAAGLTLLGILAKESAGSLALLLPVTELVLFRCESRSRRWSALLKAGHTLAAAGFVAAVAHFAGFFTGRWQETYLLRDFSLFERLLTEGRVILFYLGQTLVPRVNEMSLYHDDLMISRGLFDPPTALLSWLVIAGLVGAALIFRTRFPVLAWGVLWYFAGHLMESTVLPLELVHEHRNYLPSVGLIGALVILAARGLPSVRAPARVLAAVLPVAVLSLLTFSRAQTWSDPVTHALVEAEHNPNSPRCVYRVAYAYHGMYLMHGERAYYEETLAWLEKAAQIDESYIPPYFEMMRIMFAEGEEPPPHVLEGLEYRLANYRMERSETDYFRRLLPCIKGGICKLSVADTLSLYAAALSNPELRATDRAKILRTLADFYVNVGRDPDAAVRVMEDVVEIEPELDINHVNLARTLSIAGDTAGAFAVLDDMEARVEARPFDLPGSVTAADLVQLRKLFHEQDAANLAAQARMAPVTE